MLNILLLFLPRHLNRDVKRPESCTSDSGDGPCTKACCRALKSTKASWRMGVVHMNASMNSLWSYLLTFFGVYEWFLGKLYGEYIFLGFCFVFFKDFFFSLGQFSLLFAAFWCQNLWFACYLLHFGVKISDLLLAFGFWLLLFAFGFLAFGFWLSALGFWLWLLAFGWVLLL